MFEVELLVIIIFLDIIDDDELLVEVFYIVIFDVLEVFIWILYLFVILFFIAFSMEDY